MATTAKYHPLSANFYLASQAFSVLGNSVAGIVWPWLVLERTGDPMAAGLVATVIAVPSILFAIVGGHLIDTFGRKPVCIVSDLISSASVFSLIVVDQITGLNLAWFIIIGVLGAVGDIPGMAARQALVGDVSQSSGRSLDWLSGGIQSIAGVTLLIGPAVAGMLIGFLPITSVLYITAGCSLLAALLTTLVRIIPPRSITDKEPSSLSPAAEALEDTNVFSGWRAWRNILTDPQVSLLAWVNFASLILISPYFMVLLPAQFQLINKPTYLGFSMSGFAIGMIVCGIVVARVGTAKRRQMWTIGLISYTIASLCLAVLQVAPVVIAGMAIAGIGSGLHGPLQTVIVTENIPDDTRGRAFSLFSAIQLVAQPFGLAAATALLSFTSIYVLAIGVATLYVPVAIAGILRGRTVIMDRVAASDKKDDSTT